MLRRLVMGTAFLLVTAAAVGAAVYRYCPALRARIIREMAQIGGWTEEARRADPVGFVAHARSRLQKDLEAIERTRRQLAAEIGQLSKKVREQQAMRDHARVLAGEFRAQYRLASAGSGFPVVVRNAAYTEEQAVGQVSMLLAEAEGYEAALAALEQVKQEAESQLEALTVRINDTESQLAALVAEGMLLEVKMLSDEGEKLLAQVDDLLHDNAQVIEGNPVRNVRELLDAEQPPAQQRTNRDAAVAFLAEEPTAGDPTAEAPIAEEPIVRGQGPSCEDDPQQVLSQEKPQPADQDEEATAAQPPAREEPVEAAVREQPVEAPVEEEKPVAAGQEEEAAAPEAPAVEAVTTALRTSQQVEKPTPKKKQEQKAGRAARKQKPRQEKPAPKNEQRKPGQENPARKNEQSKHVGKNDHGNPAGKHEQVSPAQAPVTAKSNPADGRFSPAQF